MLRFTQTEHILKVMKDKEKIRNVGILAHIDHGKTTLTDLLLAEAGLIPYSLAGEIRALDYLEEEQRRGITIKTANISLLHRMDGREYVVNLVDTPGHVDFTGRVTRALRAIDGAVIIVDAVEEIMAQTEVVLRQALCERVKPVLFINKVDRLINELKMNTEEIRAKISRIIQSFNNLIEIYSEPIFKDHWKVSFSRGSVVIGSALHKWGLTFEVAEKRGIKFSDIIKAYQSGDLRSLQKEIPLPRAVLELIVRELPNPAKAQRYRVVKIWRGDVNSKIGRAMIECDPNGPIMICVTGVKADQRKRLIATGRIFSGEVSEGSNIYLLGVKKESIIRDVSIYMGPFRESVKSLDSGNMVALSGFDFISSGETIVDVKYKDEASPFEKITYIQEPVITVSIEPKDPRDLEHLIDLLTLLSIEDPNLITSVNRETGELLLSGIGELQIDIALKTLKEYEPKIEVIVSEPRVSYRESVGRRGMQATVKSPNGLNWVSVKVEPLESPNTSTSSGRILYVNKYGNYLIDLTGEIFSEEN
ncbi:MAG: GTP-binding protein, partial [Candidatus Bathyarchaeia archaeon]